MDRSILIDEMETIVISNEKLKEEIYDDFTPSDEEDNKLDYLSMLYEVGKKLEIIEKVKIDIKEFYSKTNINHAEMLSQKIIIRNYVSYKFTKEITFYALDLKFCIYDLFIDKTFANTIDWVNYIEKYFER